MKFTHKPPEYAPRMFALAKCDLGIARIGKISEDICYQGLITLCQQAIEKSLKALLIHNDIEYPHHHLLKKLIEDIENNGIVLPEAIKKSARSTVEIGSSFPSEFPMTFGSVEPLSEYAGNRRYSFSDEGVPDEQEYKNVLSRAENVVNWVEQQIQK